MTPPKIIGLAGRKRSGKDTAAIALQGYDRVSFAKPIKTMLRVLLSAAAVPSKDIERMVEGDLKEVPTPALGGHTPRHAMQTLGTEWGRQMISNTLWIDTALADAAASGYGTVITDVRFANEAAAIKAAGGVVIRVERPNRPIGVLEDHPSETAIDTLDVDFVLVNDAPNALDFQYAARAFFRENLNIQ